MLLPGSLQLPFDHTSAQRSALKKPLHQPVKRSDREGHGEDDGEHRQHRLHHNEISFCNFDLSIGNQRRSQYLANKCSTPLANNKSNDQRVNAPAMIGWSAPTAINAKLVPFSQAAESLASSSWSFRS